MKLNNELINRASDAARQKCLGYPNGTELFEQVIRIVQQIDVLSVQGDLGNDDKMKVHLAGLFLYTGGNTPTFIDDAIVNISEFLHAESIGEETIFQIKEVLLCIKPPQMPMTAAGQVLCDALNSFWVENGKGVEVDLPVFVQKALFGRAGDGSLVELKQFVEKIGFFTPVANKMFEKPKRKKISWLQQCLEQQSGESNLSVKPESATNYHGMEQEKPQMARGTETMFRIASREHSELLNLVHQKSGFLASINAIILSIILSVLSTKLDENPHLLIPTILLLITCVTTIYYVIMATRPVFMNATNASFNPETENIMFFGHFSNMQWKDYRDKLKKITKDDIALFDTFSKNIYYQGLVLKKKYNLLAIGYNVFIGGLIISILAFVISLVWRSYAGS